MSILRDLFSGTGTNILTVIFALALVLILIILIIWFLKFFNKITQSVSLANKRRLAIVDKIHIDQKRQLILLRRDDIEHLILIGGGNDLLIETNIKIEQYYRAKKIAVSDKDSDEKSNKNNKSAIISKAATLTKNADENSASSKSLRHTALFRRNNEPEFENNPQSFAKIDDKIEPNLRDSDKDSTSKPDIERRKTGQSATENNRKRRKTD